MLATPSCAPPPGAGTSIPHLCWKLEFTCTVQRPVHRQGHQRAAGAACTVLASPQEVQSDTVESPQSADVAAADAICQQPFLFKTKSGSRLLQATAYEMEMVSRFQEEFIRPCG